MFFLRSRVMGSFIKRYAITPEIKMSIEPIRKEVDNPIANMMAPLMEGINVAVIRFDVASVRNALFWYSRGVPTETKARELAIMPVNVPCMTRKSIKTVGELTMLKKKNKIVEAKNARSIIVLCPKTSAI